MAIAYDPKFERTRNDGHTVRELAARDLISRMSELEQLTIMSWMLNGIHVGQSDRFGDALNDTMRTFEAAYAELSDIAETPVFGRAA